jgi:hypothetical protein
MNLYFSKLGCLSTKYGLKTIFGFLRAFSFNVYLACQYENLILFQIVNIKYAVRRETGTVIELNQRRESGPEPMKKF